GRPRRTAWAGRTPVSRRLRNLQHARRLRSLSPHLRGEGRGEGCLHKHMTRGPPHPNPLRLKKGEREKKEGAGRGSAGTVRTHPSPISRRISAVCSPSFGAGPAPPPAPPSLPT